MITITLEQHDSEADAGYSGVHSHLWVRDYPSDVTLRKGDEVYLWADGPYLPVKRAFLDGDGLWVVELIGLHVDPRWPQLIANGYRQAWWTKSDGDLVEQLRDNGWRPYVTRDED